NENRRQAVLVARLDNLGKRYGGQAEGTTLTGDLEVCAFSGTLSKHGMHLHMAVADPQGHMSGGHVMVGCIVRTTLELVIQEIGVMRLLRRKDPSTGYDELYPEAIVP
ncbi:MAG TPA: DNA-binding protein, partial [Flavobacteriales bacterium]|nr:DNA-binding protein [Flavobacteriales bacterium]